VQCGARGQDQCAGEAEYTQYFNLGKMRLASNTIRRLRPSNRCYFRDVGVQVPPGSEDDGRWAPLLAGSFLYAGKSVQELREALSTVFSPVHLELDRGERLSGTRFNRMPLRKSAIAYHRIGAKCVDGPLAPLDFHVLGVPLSGTHTARMGKTEVQGSVGQPIMLSGGGVPRIRHSRDSGILSWIIRDEVLGDHLSAWLGHTSSPAIRFQPTLDTSNSRTASFLETFGSFVRQLGQEGSILEYPAAVASFEEALITAMLLGLDHNLVDVLREPQPDAGSAVVRRVEEYLEAHASAPIDMPTLARVTGYSTRSIHRAFRRHRDCTPMAFLADTRMRLARRVLLDARKGAHVATIAFDCGFSHLGRFATEYRRRFGETPSETLERARRDRGPTAPVLPS
jgi:AraC-like DNA-binding protein